MLHGVHTIHPYAYFLNEHLHVQDLLLVGEIVGSLGLWHLHIHAALGRRLVEVVLIVQV